MNRSNNKHNILFLCTGNSCRSQMAEGWCRHLKGDLFNTYSAGIETHGLNPHAVTVMQEVGIDITSQKSEHIDSLKEIPFDYVITVCSHAHESCPWFPSNAKVIHHAFSDPPKMAKAHTDATAQLNCYRDVRNDIKAYIKTLPESLK